MENRPRPSAGAGFSGATFTVNVPCATCILGDSFCCAIASAGNNPSATIEPIKCVLTASTHRRGARLYLPLITNNLPLVLLSRRGPLGRHPRPAQAALIPRDTPVKALGHALAILRLLQLLGVSGI